VSRTSSSRANATTAQNLADVLRDLDSIEAGLLADMERSLVEGRPLPKRSAAEGLAQWRAAVAGEAPTPSAPDPVEGPRPPPPGAVMSGTPTFEQVGKWAAAVRALRSENETLRRDNEALTELAAEAQDPGNRPLVTRGGVGGRSSLTQWREQNLGGLIVTMRRLRAVGRVAGTEAAARIARTEGVADLASLSVGYPENLARARLLDNARVALTHGPTARLLSNPDPLFDELRASVTSQAILGAGPPGSRAIFERSAERPETRSPQE
jgi:hypothetical protein